MTVIDHKSTPLASALANPDIPQVTPLDAFRLGRKHWLSGRRLSLSVLAKELGITRGKLYHWVGNKELLLDEIIWSVAQPTFEKAINETPGTGIEHIVGVHRYFLNAAVSFKPLQQFVSHDPPYALRILSTEARGARSRIIALAASHIKKQVEKGHLQLAASPEQIAEMLIHTNESLLYHDILSGREPAVDKACAISRLLLSAGRIPEYPN